MKVVPGIVAVCLAAVSVLPSVAQPVRTAPDRDLISFNLRDSKVSEVAQMIAFQGNVSVLVHDGGDVRLKFIALHDVTPAAALQKVATAAGLVLTRVEDMTYILSKAALVMPAAPPVVTPMTGAKPYTIRIRLDSGFTQEIQVQGEDSFAVDSTMANNEWIIRGTNKLNAGVMAIDLQVEWNQGRGMIGGQSRAPYRLTTLRTQFRTPPDGKEMTLATAGYGLIVSVRKNAP